MNWCKKCNHEVSDYEATSTNEYELHSEVDTRAYETITTLRCPSCGSELVDASLCDCGEWKEQGEDYCPSCQAIADEMIHRCIKHIQAETNMDYKHTVELFEYGVGELEI